MAGIEPATFGLEVTLVFTTVDAGEGRVPSALSLHAHYLAQRVNHIYQIALRFHHGVDGLVRHRRFIDDIRILTALDAGRRLGVVIQGEPALGFGTRHGTSRSMATAHEAFRITLAAHDVRTRSHAARDDSHVALARADCPLTRDEHVLAVVVLPGHIIVMAADNFHIRFER